MKEKIGILYICTGNYHIFWKEFYKSCEKHFLPGYTKQYYVFTDTEKLFAENEENVYKIYQPKLQFPGDTLLRFDMFLRAKEKLQQVDYLYFFNANIKFITDIAADEFFPNDSENGLIGYLHFGFHDKKPEEFLYERNPISTAYIKPGDGQHYYQGCVIGGKTDAFLEMAEVLDERIKEDLKKDFIAVWWDESHLNRYLLNKKVKILHPGYAFPELEYDHLPFEKRIISRNKSIRGGVAFLRGEDKTWWAKTKFLIKKIYNKF